MSVELLGTKIGMTRVYDENGVSSPVTIIQLGPCVVTQLREQDRDGYTAVQCGFGDIKPRNSTMPLIAHDAKAGSTPLRHHFEFRVEGAKLSEFEVGQKLTVDSFADIKYVDVSGVSKGKGFQGGMKRYGFKGKEASHGVERKHRSPGSIGGHANERGGSGGPKKGKRMAGQMGNTQVTIRSLDVVRIDAERNLLLVKGAVPGANETVVRVRPAIRLYKSKAAKVAG